jgi:pimeloyl-ACP methyl ester carboxylesterase
VTAPTRTRFAGRIEAAPDASGTARAGEGVRIAWRSYGAGEPVVLVMGFMGSGHAWFRLVPHLAAGRRVIVLDNRGTGESDRPGGLWSMTDLAGDVLAVLDDAEVERPHVIGASMGGMVVQHLALEHPERTRSLTLCCTSARGGGRSGPPPWRMLASLALRPLIGAGRTLRIASPLLYSARTRRDRDRLAEEVVLRAADATPLRTAPAQFAAIARHDTREALAWLSIPVLVLHGAEDSLVPARAGRELAALIPGARLELLPDCGHVLTTDCEHEAAAAIGDFLDHVESARPGSRTRRRDC